MAPLVVLIAGGHAAGKKHATELLETGLRDRFEEINIQRVDMADYAIAARTKDGSRSPSCFDFDAIRHRVDRLCADAAVDIVVVYGLYALYDSVLLEKGSIRIFIDTDSDVRLGRWIKRDIIGPSVKDPALKKQQAAKLKALLAVYLKRSREEMKRYVVQTKENADVVLPNASELGGIRLIIDGLDPVIRQKLGEAPETSALESLVPSSGSSDSSSRLSVREALEGARKEGPTVSSLGEDNFQSRNGRFYDMN